MRSMEEAQVLVYEGSWLGGAVGGSTHVNGVNGEVRAQLRSIASTPKVSGR